MRSFFALANLEIRRKPQPVPASYFRNEEMIGGLARVKKLNLNITTIIDVGAAAGSWSLSAKELWPDCSYLLFEPLAERKAELEALARVNTNFHFVPLAAGKEKGSISFNVSDDLDGSGITYNPGTNPHIRSVEVSSIAHEITERNLKGPYMVKLDTHGFEVPIIEGCAGIMKDISLFIIECYGFHIVRNSLLFWEMNRYMSEYGFRLFDMVDIMRRPADQAFWQCDAFFIRNDHPLFKNNQYHQ